QTSRRIDQVPQADVPKPRIDAYGDPLPEGAVGRLGTLRWRHEGEAGFLAFSPDGRMLVVHSKGGAAFFDTATGKVIHRLQTISDETSIAFSPDGKLFAYQQFPNTVHLWDPATKKLLHTLTDADEEAGGQYLRRTICFSPDGKLLAASTGYNL